MMMIMMGSGNNQMSTQTEGGTGGSWGSSSGREGRAMVKKGPWTTTEDAVLEEYVRTHGEGNWNMVQKNTGLARCGKSCRLRWANHLRPNLKKGPFSPEEERIVIELHAKMGNKWARMSTQLPGRTDNEIKNYWNTRMKRRQRQGLPLYPPDIEPLHSQHQHRHTPPPSPTPTPPSPTTTSTTSCFSFQVQTPLMSLNTSMSSPLHPLHSPHKTPPQNLFYTPHSAATPPLRSPNSASTPPPLPSPSGCSTPNPISPLQSPHHQPPPFPTLPLFGYPSSTTTNTHSGDGFFHSNKRFKHDGSQSNNFNNNNSFVYSPVPHYPNRTTPNLASSSRTTSFHHPNMVSRFFHPLKTELHSSQINNDEFLEIMLEAEAQVMAGNKEMQNEMNTSRITQHEREEEEDYSRLINSDGPSSMGMAINQWCNYSGESSDRQPSVITDNENHLPLPDISPTDAAKTSSARPWDNFPGIC